MFVPLQRKNEDVLLEYFNNLEIKFGFSCNLCVFI